MRYLCLLLLFLNINLYNNKRKENGCWAPLNINGGRCCIIGSCVSRDDGSGREGGPPAAPKAISALAETTTAAVISGRASGQARQAGWVGWWITAAS